MREDFQNKNGEIMWNQSFLVSGSRDADRWSPKWYGTSHRKEDVRSPLWTWITWYRRVDIGKDVEKQWFPSENRLFMLVVVRPGCPGCFPHRSVSLQEGTIEHWLTRSSCNTRFLDPNDPHLVAHRSRFLADGPHLDSYGIATMKKSKLGRFMNLKIPYMRRGLLPV